jgi:hypothetical protein
MYKFVVWETYTDNGTTVMDAYLADYFEPADPDPSTILMSHLNA